MMKRTTERKISHILLVSTVLCLLVAVLCACTYAAYTNSRSAQRTIATYDAQGERFSSNILAKGYSRENVKTVYVTDATEDPFSVVMLRNYELGKQTPPYFEDISYTLTVRLVRYDNTAEERYVPVDAAYMTANELSAYQVTIAIDETTVTLSSSHLSDDTLTGTLTGGEKDSDSYTVTFTPNFTTEKPNLYLEMIATPSNDGLQTLRGIFKTDVRAEGATNAWTGSFSDDTSSAPAAYDGYNYMITGAGTGTVTLSWDDTKLTLSYQSLLTLLAIGGATQTGSSLTFPVDSDVDSRYDLQFYKVAVISENWSQMNSTIVRFRFQ